MLDISLQYDASAKRLNVVDCPDIQLMALLIISLKLCYGLDDDDISKPKNMKNKATVTRHAEKQWEIANIKPDWAAWKKIIQMNVTDVQSQHEDGGQKRDKNWQLSVDEGDIYSWTEREMDEYLDWFENNFEVSGEGKPTAGIAKLFDNEKEESNDIEEGEEETGDQLRRKLLEKRVAAFKKMQAAAEIGVAVPRDQPKAQGENKTGVNRPGEGYMRYLRWEDVKGEKMRTLYLAAAERLGVTVEGMAFVIQKLEYMCWEKAKAKRKKNRAEKTEVQGGERGSVGSDGEIINEAGDEEEYGYVSEIERRYTRAFEFSQEAEE
ncbi:hypothetical protein AA313_de0207488 [Arthrobotrys entomopaga]|nr:hypothetical protein AA313_de0207488 [Arthrobotrys entomopaga]